MASRSWCFTINNPTTVQIRWEDCPIVRYVIWQLERGDEGTSHVQGYMELKRPTRMSQVKNFTADMHRAHLEPRRGTREEARDYCRKEETRVEGPYEYGEWLEDGQGHRSDLSAIKTMLDSGHTLLDVADGHFGSFLRYNKGIQLYMLMKGRSRDRNQSHVVILLIGEPGTGKTKWAYDNYPSLYRKDSNTLWWDGYTGQPCVLLDDFTGGVPYGTLLQWLDRYPVNAQVKGGYLNLSNTTTIITSNNEPARWYNTIGDIHVRALERRITRSVRLGIDGTTVWEEGYIRPMGVF